MTPILLAAAATGSAALAAALVAALVRHRLRHLARPVRLPSAVVALTATTTAGLGAATAAGALDPRAALLLGLLATWCLLLAAADVVALRLPDALTLPGAAVVLGAAALGGRLVPAVVGGLALGGAHLVVHLLAPRAVGAGDVKLALGLGAATGACGAAPWLLAALLAPLLTGLLAVAAVVLRRAGPGSALPHGPALCLAAWLAAAAALA